MKKNSVTEFELEKQDFKIRLKRGSNGGGAPVVSYEEPPTVPYGQVAPPVPATIAAVQVHPAPASPELEIKSPMIGTFYRAPSPEAASYVEVGSDVNPDTVVCIIEAMKVMNEIKAEVEGEVVSILIETGESVEFGQPMLTIRRAGAAK